MNPVFEDLEVEELSLHPSVWERMKRLRGRYLTQVITLRTSLPRRFEPRLSLDWKYGKRPSNLL